MLKKTRKKLLKYTPVALLLVVLASTASWAFYRLVYTGFELALPWFTEVERNIIIVVVSFVLLLLAGYKLQDIIK